MYVYFSSIKLYFPSESSLSWEERKSEWRKIGSKSLFGYRYVTPLVISRSKPFRNFPIRPLSPLRKSPGDRVDALTLPPKRAGKTWPKRGRSGNERRRNQIRNKRRQERAFKPSSKRKEKKREWQGQGEKVHSLETKI